MTVSSLAGLQSAFKRYLLAGDNEGDLAAQVGRVGGIPAETRLDVYRSAHYLRLEEALARDFPALRAVVGDEAFGRLAAAYLTANPSTRPSLRFLGQRLPGWLRRGCSDALGDLAALEWAALQAFDARDARRLTAADLKGVPPARWPHMHLRLHPSVTLCAVHVNVREVWLAVRRARPAPAIESAQEWLVVWRSEGGPAVEATSERFHSFLAALSHDPRFSAACETIAQSVTPGEVPRVAAECLHSAVARGWLAGPPALQVQRVTPSTE